jgi:hypothetical protein
MPIEKKNVTLVFPTLADLEDFEASSGIENVDIDRVALTIAGTISERDIEFAFNVYQAKVVENESF